MKSRNRVVCLLVSALSALLLAGCSHTPETAASLLDGTEWHLQTASEVNAAEGTSVLLAAGSDAWATEDGVPVLDVVLVAEDGKLTITDNSNAKTYTGTCRQAEAAQDSAGFEVTLEGLSGYGAVSVTKYADGTETPTLPITVVDGDLQYALYFQAE